MRRASAATPVRQSTHVPKTSNVRARTLSTSVFKVPTLFESVRGWAVKGVVERARVAEMHAWEETVKGVMERARSAEIDAWEMETERARSAEGDAWETMIR